MAPIVVADRTVRLGFVTIAPGAGLSLVRGGVTLADGTPCLFFQRVFRDRPDRDG